MLSSSKEYLQALREGKYLLFLEWPQFIVELYKDGDHPQDADDTVNLLVFEWLNNGYCEDDAKKIALLYAVSDLPAKPLKNNLSYAITTISIAVFQCMTYQSNNLQDYFLSNEKKSRAQIKKLMNDPIEFWDESTLVNLDASAFQNLLAKQQLSFFTWVDNMSGKEVDNAWGQIRPLAELRYLAEEYSTQLEISKLADDPLKASRLSVVKRLALYLNGQSELTSSVTAEIELYVNKIREMQPADFEKEYLLTMSPLSFDKTWRMITSLGLSFFKLMQPIPSIVLSAESAPGSKT
ncbi:helical bundle domain-containing protein [Legionella maioricensis]|uniref:Helical bundle domain-containing protein n=1 Tax=Legionella maioricensis TaxID=2896528 RepID=A0A9X2CYV0_9GAMM|nr:helical bundle domain-containing protein [Legionella maioricensis]MCL9683266.1 helical bundle domain-containing protein [Legionella maioricensis]MCL9686037.1 helical bundle domain-containing protein [Legionella maioricensis]